MMATHPHPVEGGQEGGMGVAAAVGFSVRTRWGTENVGTPDFGNVLWEDELDGWVGMFGTE